MKPSSLFRSLLITGTLASLAGVALGKSRAETTRERVAANPDARWWEVMDTGPFHSDTFLGFGPEGEVAVLKGIAIKLGQPESHSMVFDTETLRMVAGFEGRAAPAGTPWNGKHAHNSHLPEDREVYFFSTKQGPGVAVAGDWKDPRHQKNGPLPSARAKYLGLYRHDKGTVLSYSVGGTQILERPWTENGALLRSFQIDKMKQPVELLALDPLDGGKEIEVTLRNAPKGVSLKELASGRTVISIDKESSGTFDLIYLPVGAELLHSETPDLKSLTKGGPSLFPEEIALKGRLSEAGAGYAVDDIPLPKENPWASNIRFGAFDFFPDGKRAACSTWNGDVWVVEGIGGDLTKVTWRRFASGLFQTLGLKIVDGVIHTLGRDQITRLHDLNNDGEADFYECFNNDVLITKGFHEFAFDLQTDKDGNFYFSKGAPVQSGGRGFTELTNHSGTILKVSPDGKTLTRMARGLRAPGGLGIGPNGELTTGENEGSYVPRCKITWSKPDGSSFHGVVPSEWDGREFVRCLPGNPTDYERPLCWLPYFVDNSSGSQFWVPEESAWQTHAGQMLHLSYGKSSVYRTLIDEVDGQVQGGVYRLPIELTTAVMRGRFHPQSGHLYLIGFRGWQTNGGTGLQRIRFVSEEHPVPTSLKAHQNGIQISFSKSLSAEVATDPRRYEVSKWDYVWGPQYGSGRFSIDEADVSAREKALVEPSKESANEVDPVQIRAVSLLEDGKSVFLYIPDMTPAMQMEIRMDLESTDQIAFRETIWNTVHNLRPEFAAHGLDLANLPEIINEPLGEPGLILSTSKGSSDDAVVVDRMALTVEERGAITPFIASNQAVFEGTLVVDARDERAFRLEGQGWAVLKVGGQTILEGELPLESKPLALEAGPQSIFCHFKKAPKGTSRMRLLWKGSGFLWEPVRPSAFRYSPNSMLAVKDKARKGRDLFAAARCVQCHKPDRNHFKPGARMPELFEQLPDFKNIGNRMRTGWLEQWVRKPSDHCPSVAPDEAADVAAYLSTLREKELPTSQGNSESGEALIEQLHFEPWAAQFSGRAKYTPGGLRNLLLAPNQHAKHSTIPDLGLSEAEASDISAWIESQYPEAILPTGGDAKRGREVAANRCATCHEPDQNRTYEFPAKDLKAMWESEWQVHGCLSEEEGNAPELGLGLAEKQALLAFKNIDGNKNYSALRRFVPHEYISRTQTKLQCASCHTGENKIPGIDLAGEKLEAAWLEKLFRGQAHKVRPWLPARMPAFEGRAVPLAKGLAYRAGMPLAKESFTPDPELVQTGGEIAGLTVYACVTCHAAGDRSALQAFEGQGPNLQLAGERLRPDYYHAWMNWPQRFSPLTIMPKYTTANGRALREDYYDGDATRQFEAIRHWLKTLEGVEKAPVIPKQE